MRLLIALLLSAAPAAAKAPKLIVAISVDQMRAEYLDRFANDFTGGFARLSKDGAVFTKARHGHVPTETGVGHAALLTGCFPSEHGIVANDWYDRKSGKDMYCVEDHKFGRSPANLQCPTVGDALKEADARSRVVSVSGKDRSAILMAGQRADSVVLWYDKKTGTFTTSGYYGEIPAWAKAWNDKNTVAPEERKGAPLTPLYDHMVLQLARLAVDSESLGTDDAPDLLAVNLSGTDYVGHQFGPDSPQMHQHLRILDKNLGAFFTALDARLGHDGYLVALSADHGVAPVPESAQGQAKGGVRLDPEKFWRDLELPLQGRFGQYSKDGKGWIASIAVPHVYLNLAAAREKGIDAAAFRKGAAEAIAKHPNVARVYDSLDLAGGKVAADAPFAEVFRRSAGPRGGELMVLLKEGVVWIDKDTATSHNLPYDDDARVPLVLMGPGIKPGRYDAPVLATSLAPTLGVLLEVPLPARGPNRPLSDAFAPAAH